MSFDSRKVLIYIAIASVVIFSFFLGRKFHFRSGFNAGALFADTSGYKQGYNIGFAEGYELRDSIAKKEIALRAADVFNLNIIYEELGNPARYMELSCELIEKQPGRGSSVKYAKCLIKSLASFARYDKIKIKAKFFDKRKSELKELTFVLPEVLYPGRSIIFEITGKDVPEFAESVEIKLESAHGIE